MAGDRNGALLIEARGIRKTIGGREVLSDAGLAVTSGEVVTLIGPNGAGKSVLVRIMMGVLDADAGTVYRRPGLTIGYLPQRIEIDPALPLTVRRLLSLAGSGRGRAEEVLAEVGAAETLTKPVQGLSGGEFQRVMLARALMRRPDLLVLDEPLRGVDLSGQADLYALIGDIRRRYGAGVLMVSHDLHLVMAETDSVVCLNRRVCCAGHPETVSRDPAYKALFGPAVAGTVAVYAHPEHEHGHEHGTHDDETARPEATGTREPGDA